MTTLTQVQAAPKLPKFSAKETVMVMYSGGVDSTVVCAYLKSYGLNVIAVYFDDNSTYYLNRRLLAITKSLQALDLFHTSYCMKTYEYERLRDTRDSFGLLPGLKMVFQVQLMALAQRFNVRYIATGYNHENVDYPYVFNDELPENIKAISTLYNKIYGTKIKVISPFVDMDKSEIIALNSMLKQPAKLDWTYSCKELKYGGLVHCGACFGCRSRATGFEKAQALINWIGDPTEYHQDPLKSELQEAVLPSVGAVVFKRENNASSKT